MLMKCLRKFSLPISFYSVIALLVVSAVAVAQAPPPDLTNHFTGAKMPLPPPGHPRLFVRDSHIGQIKRNFHHAELKPVWERVVALAKNESSKSLKVPADTVQGNFDVDVIR